ncbi:MAG: TonB-dependent receptor [Bacteriovoracaceae bacterium]|nr:TonB-dependent receptor [Bacteriovoracaceae bacterium]
MKFSLFLPFLLVSTSILANRPVLNTHNADEIYVFGHRQSSDLVDFVASVTELSGEELLLKRETSLGDTLSKEVGISSTGYGPNSSRPVIRGLDGDRIKMLQNGLGTLDASTQSVDHALSIDTLTIDQIEVVRGPMSLLYGSSAVGGVVNILTDRIHRDFEKGFYSKFNVEGQTAQPGVSQSLVLNYGINKWMIHVDASARNLGELKVPGFARTSSVRSSEARSNETPGEVLNSFNKQKSGGIGVSRILEKGYIGLSYSNLDNVYGTVSETDVTIDMTQNRFEFHFDHALPFKIFDRIRVKSTQANYKHIEFEGATTGTVFTNEGNETRIEIDNKKDNLEGVTGIHTRINDFAANGSEAFLPSSQSTMLSVFTLQELKLGNNSISSGLRFEKNEIEKESSTRFGASEAKDFSNLNGSLGHQYRLNKSSSLNQSFSYTERAPTAQELFANGPHIASSTFERGSSRLRKEKALAYEVNYKFKEDQTQWQISGFAQHFKNFITLTPSGQTDTESTLPIYNYLQVDANFIGAELSGLTPIMQNGDTSYSLKTSLDYVRGRATGGRGDLARITPMRLGTGLRLSRSRWLSDLDLRYVFKQDKISQGETITPSYFLMDLSMHYDLVVRNYGLTLYGKVNNIFDQEARNHVSTIKNIAPLPGRNAVLGIQGTF